MSPPPILCLFAFACLLMPAHAQRDRRPARPTGRHHRSARSQEVRRQFQALHPCPSTGKTTGPCPGYIRDHIKPLACGGADSPDNMQWQTVSEAKEKDKTERKNCSK